MQNPEIRASPISLSVIALAIIGVTFISRQPLWFLWFVRAGNILMLVTLWYQSLRELYKRKRSGGQQGDQGRAGGVDAPSGVECEIQGNATMKPRIYITDERWADES